MGVLGLQNFITTKVGLLLFYSVLIVSLSWILREVAKSDLSSSKVNEGFGSTFG